jgi:hypothetical protein
MSARAEADQIHFAGDAVDAEQMRRNIDMTRGFGDERGRDDGLARIIVSTHTTWSGDIRRCNEAGAC